MHPNKSITGRDGLIQAKAFTYAIAMIQSLPKERQEWADMRDMCTIARTEWGNILPMLVMGVQHQTGIEIDIWPESDADLSKSDRLAKRKLKADVTEQVASIKKQLAASSARQGAAS